MIHLFIIDGKHVIGINHKYKHFIYQKYCVITTHRNISHVIAAVSTCYGYQSPSFIKHTALLLFNSESRLQIEGKEPVIYLRKQTAPFLHGKYALCGRFYQRLKRTNASWHQAKRSPAHATHGMRNCSRHMRQPQIKNLHWTGRNTEWLCFWFSAKFCVFIYTRLICWWIRGPMINRDVLLKTVCYFVKKYT